MIDGIHGQVVVTTSSSLAKLQHSVGDLFADAPPHSGELRLHQRSSVVYWRGEASSAGPAKSGTTLEFEWLSERADIDHVVDTVYDVLHRALDGRLSDVVVTLVRDDDPPEGDEADDES